MVARREVQRLVAQAAATLGATRRHTKPLLPLFTMRSIANQSSRPIENPCAAVHKQMHQHARRTDQADDGRVGNCKRPIAPENIMCTECLESLSDWVVKVGLVLTGDRLPPSAAHLAEFTQRDIIFVSGASQTELADGGDFNGEYRRVPHLRWHGGHIYAQVPALSASGAWPLAGGVRTIRRNADGSAWEFGPWPPKAATSSVDSRQRAAQRAPFIFPDGDKHANARFFPEYPPLGPGFFRSQVDATTGQPLFQHANPSLTVRFIV